MNTSEECDCTHPSECMYCSNMGRSIERENARLRELVEWYKSGIESCWHAANTYDGNYTAACDNVMSIASARLNHKINCAPAPEEPVIQENRITEPVPLEPEKQLPAGYKGTRRWDEEPAPEWRELGPEEVIQEGDEWKTIDQLWRPANIWAVGRKPLEYTRRFRTRRPLPAPEEPVTQDGATMSEWYGGFSKIESTEPVIQENRITEPMSDDYMLGCDPNEEPISYEEPASEWRELGKDEVICEGDEYKVLGTWKRDSELKGMKVKHAGGTFRTRRPLPKQEEERPILKVMEYCRKWADEHLADHGKETFYASLGLLVDFATDFYSNEIQKLKASVNKTKPNS